jgi:hypothetical protein
MTLSKETINELAFALKDEVIEYIVANEKYANFLMDIIPEAITVKMGPVESHVLYEISNSVMDHIDLY